MVELGQRPERSEELLKRAQWFKGPMVVLVNKVDTGDEETIFSRPWRPGSRRIPRGQGGAHLRTARLNVTELRKSYLIEHAAGASGLLPEG
jgi:hypothetical protein